MTQNARGCDGLNENVLSLGVYCFHSTTGRGPLGEAGHGSWTVVGVRLWDTAGHSSGSWGAQSEVSGDAEADSGACREAGRLVLRFLSTQVVPLGAEGNPQLDLA